MNYRADRVYKETKDVGKVLIELAKELQEYERNFYTTYDLLKAKSFSIIKDPPNGILAKSFNRKIKNLYDCNHLSVILKYAVEHNKRMFFISLDNTDLASDEKREFIYRNYFFIRVEVPMYAIDLIKKFIKKDPPLMEIKKIAKLPRELIELAKLIKKALGVDIISFDHKARL